MTTAVLNCPRIDLPFVNWKRICIIGFFACLSLLMFYVWQVNSLTHGYYLINSYENQLNSLSKENKSLEVTFAEASFWGQASERMQELNFHKTTSVKYIKIPGSYLAKAN